MKKWINKNIIGFSLASFLNDFCHEMTTALLPSFIQQLGGSAHAPQMLGIIQGIADAASTIMKLISGWLADRVIFYKPFLVIGYGLTSVVALIGTAHSMWTVLLYKTIAWMSRGIREPMRDTWIAKIISPAYYGRAFGFHRAFDTLGALFGPLCAFVLLKFDFSVRSIFLISFIPGILSCLPILFLTKEKPEKNNRTNYLSFYESLKAFPAQFNYFLLIMFVFGIANFNQTLLILRAQEVLTGQAFSSVLATGWAVLFYAVFNIVRGLSEFGMGTLSDFVNRKNLLALFGFGLFAIACCGFMFQITSLFVWFVLFACAGMSAGTVKSLEKSYAAQLLPAAVRGTGMGVLQTVDGIGDLISSVIVGMLWGMLSIKIGLLYAIILSLFAMMLMLAAD